MSKRLPHVAYFCFGEPYADTGLDDPVVVRKEFPDADNIARVMEACPWAEAIQMEGYGYCAYEDGHRARRRREVMAQSSGTNLTGGGMLKRVRLN